MDQKTLAKNCPLCKYIIAYQYRPLIPKAKCTCKQYRWVAEHYPILKHGNERAIRRLTEN